MKIKEGQTINMQC